jgi:uncharacterized circularly permuted ATP-grasp superfamily protein/uncharacterized alpha-E superfamily protein
LIFAGRPRSDATMSAVSEASRQDRPPELGGLLSRYKVQPGLYDEMLDADGQVRPQWLPFVTRLASLGPAELASRFVAADRHLRESGVFFRVYDDTGGERHWPLSHVPLLISAEDWKQIKAGVVQRAGLIEALLADCYGPRNFVERGWLPAAAVAGSSEYIRPIVGTAPLGGRHLAFYAVDLGRSPDGNWWVIRDRAQAPSGAGYAMENRTALARAFADIYRGLPVERLNGFFDAFRGWLSAFRQPDDAGVCLLTPGRLNETYFEHAYLARHLGLRLVEGDDLTVRDRKVYLRTIAGLRRVAALWRRVDSDFCDPLELNQRSRLGVPGLIQAIRSGNVMVANALGAGLAEVAALMSFMPSLAEHLLEQPLLLPNVATWWCGQATERRYVLQHLNDLAIAPAFSAAGPLAGSGAVVAEMDPAQRRDLVEELGRRGVDFVGQEVVKLSTTPVWVDDHLEPRPFVLRVFVAATADGWHVMPGGFGLIGNRVDARAVTMQHGASAADVWVLTEGRAPPPVTPLPAIEAPIRRVGALASRAADNLFWLARYLERIEVTLRLVRALMTNLVEGGEPRAATRVADMLFKWGAAASVTPQAVGSAAAQALYGTGPGAVPEVLAGALGTASAIRNLFPRDALLALDELGARIAATAPAAGDRAILEVAGAGLRIIASVAGFEMEGMNRLAGWRFFQLGRRIERAINTSRLTRQFADANGDPDSLDILLELIGSQDTYRGRYLLSPRRAPVLDLVLLDDANPRSLIFDLIEIVGHLTALPHPPRDDGALPVVTAAEELIAEIRALDPTALAAEQLIAIENKLMALSNQVTLTFVTFRGAATAGDYQS